MELQGLVSEYVNKLNSLSSLADLKEVLQDEDDTLINEYGNLAKNAVCLSTTFKEYREEGVKARDLNSQLQGLVEEMANMNERLDALMENVPKYMPGSQPNVDSTAEPLPMLTGVRRQDKKPLAGGKNTASGEAGRARPKYSVPPTLPYITAQEFGNVPKYMKGRILYSEANKAIDVINQAASQKYKLLNKTKGLTDQQRRKKIDYLELESKESENTNFVTETDISDQSTKVDKHFLSVLTILRHCGRVRQLRAGKITKYVLLHATAEA